MTVDTTMLIGLARGEIKAKPVIVSATIWHEEFVNDRCVQGVLARKGFIFDRHGNLIPPWWKEENLNNETVHVRQIQDPFLRSRIAYGCNRASSTAAE